MTREKQEFWDSEARHHQQVPLFLSSCHNEPHVMCQYFTCSHSIIT